MNKYLIIIGILVLILLAGLLYRVFLLPEESAPYVSGQTREITIVARENKWTFDPETIEVNHGDRIIATIINEDNYDHGIGLDVFGISQRMPAKSTIKVEFVASKAGEFPFYCSVPCGEGIVEGQKRGHFDMVGKLHIRSVISETQ